MELLGITGTAEAQLPPMFPASEESNNDSSQWTARGESAAETVVSEA